MSDSWARVTFRHTGAMCICPAMAFHDTSAVQHFGNLWTSDNLQRHDSKHIHISDIYQIFQQCYYKDKAVKIEKCSGLEIFAQWSPFLVSSVSHHNLFNCVHILCPPLIHCLITIWFNLLFQKKNQSSLKEFEGNKEIKNILLLLITVGSNAGTLVLSW
jgi:hypothetical protein